MATQTLTYTSTNLLDCATSSVGCVLSTPADIILCVDSALVAQGECPITLEDTNFVYNTIPAIVYSYYPFKQCGIQYYEYRIAYDDEYLIPDTNLVCTDIVGMICEGCLTTFIRDYAGQEVSIQTIEGVQTLVTQHGCEYPIVTSGYEWTFSGDSGPVQTVDNTDNVEYIGGASISTTTGAGEQLTIDFVLSSDPDQILDFDGSGNLLLTCDEVSTCISQGIIADQDTTSENPAEDISAVGTYGPFAATGLLTYNNPSAVNPITVYYILEYEAGLQAVESAGNFIGRLSVNGGGLTSIGNFFYTTNNALGADQPHTLRTQQVGIATIAGGGSLTLEADQTIDIVNPAAGAADWLTAQTTVTVYGTNVI